MTTRNGILCYFAGVICALALLTTHSMVVEQAFAQDPPKGGAGDWQAAGGPMFNKANTGCLWVYNPDEKQLACYAVITGRNIKHIGSRRVTYDLKLKAVNDKSQYTPDKLKELYDKKKD